MFTPTEFHIIGAPDRLSCAWTWRAQTCRKNHPSNFLICSRAEIIHNYTGKWLVFLFAKALILGVWQGVPRKFPEGSKKNPLSGGFRKLFQELLVEPFRGIPSGFIDISGQGRIKGVSGTLLNQCHFKRIAETWRAFHWDNRGNEAFLENFKGLRNRQALQWVSEAF